MRVLFLLLLVLVLISTGFTQNNLPGMPPKMTPEMLEMIKKSMPPGAQLPQGMEQYGNTDEPGAAKPLVGMPPVQMYQYTQESSEGTTSPVLGSGRNDAERKAAVDAVDAELERELYILPKKEDAPTKSIMLLMAQTRSKAAHQKFGPDDLSAFSQVITWVPNFDGIHPQPEKAKEMSLLVSTSTNYLNLPQFILAVSSAVFALDPESSNNANNFASAIITTGERLNPTPIKPEVLVPYYKDAESGFLYAMAITMKEDAWTNESLTPIINLGNLYIDMHRLDEARSLFQVARKLDPLSWDAALGMAAYFHAIGQPDKALAILEDDKLNKPVSLLIAKKSARELEKSEPYADLPPDSPEEKYEEGIEIMTAEPIMTSADFIAQIDQSERNKMRYFIEHLPAAGSYSVPKINKLTQYSTLKVISGPQGISALKDFIEMVGNFSISSAASTSKQQMEWLARMGLKIDPGIDMEDVAKHPEKYKDKNLENNVKVTGKEEFLANIEEMKRQAQVAKNDLATGKTASLLEIAGKVDPFFNILLIDPEQYADPMNILIQKHNFAVYNRKKHLYEMSLYKVNKKTYQYVMEDVQKAQKKIGELTIKEHAELEAFEKRYEEEKKKYDDQENFPEAEWKLMRHSIHQSYFNQFNNAAETGFGSATNTATIAYMKRIKPTAEGYYYDVIRHIGLISDPTVRDQKDAELKSTINSAVTMALNSVMIAHGSFSYSEDWDCGCDVEALLREREAEEAANHEEENARIMRNKAAKAVFDSGEIPKSSPLWKKLDSFVDEYNLGFIKVRSSCAQTVVKLNTDIMPIPGIPKLFGSMTTSENTGATDYQGGIKVGIGVQKNGVNVGANIGLSGSVSTDGQGVVKDYSITPSADLSVKVGNTGVTVGGSLTFDQNGVKDSDFSAGVSQDFKNGYGTEGNVGFEASTKRGCSLSGKVAHDVSVKPPKDPNDKGNEDKIKPVDNTESKFFKKTLWSGKYELKL